MSDLNPFTVGGPVLPDSRVYIERDADRDAAHHLRRMDYIALIEPHQQGKTSLIGHLMKMFPYDRGYCWVYVDLSSWPSPMQPAEWNAALKDCVLKRIQVNCTVLFQILDSPTDHLKWFDFLEALGKRAAAMGIKLVIAFDEIAAIPSECALGFFQPMRAVYSHRISRRHFNHLSFIISCAYSPALLEEHSPCSHFLNSCQRIDIDDFTLNQVKQLVAHIPNLTAGARQEVVNRVFFWVDGHPFLTQWLCASLLKDRLPPTSAGVDSAVQRFQQNDIEHWPNIARKLSIYSDLREEVARILSGNQFAFAPSSSDEIRALELMGLVKADSQNYCKIRNRLYERLLKDLLREGDLQMNLDPASAWAVAILSKATDWLFNQVGEVLKERREKRKQEAVAKEPSISGPAPSEPPPITKANTLLAALEQQAKLSAQKMEIMHVEALMRQVENHQKKISDYQEKLSGYLSEEARLRFENYLAKEQEKVEGKADEMRRILERLSGQSIHIPALDG